MFDWNDLRYFLAIAREGSSLAAARSLGVNQSTVQRRVAEIESRLGLRLVQRSTGGYRLTAAGLAVLPAAMEVAAAVESFERKAAEAAHASVLRLTCPEPIAVRMTRAGVLERFHARYPDIRIVFVLADRYVDLAKGEADVALRSGDTDDALVGRKVAESIWAVYASRAYVERHGAPASIEALREHPIIAFDESLSRHRLSLWLRDVVPQATYAARTDSVLGLVSAAKAGIGVAALPIALGDSEPELVRVLAPVAELTRPWRVLAHPDARRLPRVAAFFDFLAAEGDALRPILTG
jgi:DNA-binding transcriptional LysR family regulator